MNSGSQLVFPPFRLDSANQRLWRDAQEIRLRQKTFAVLRYLVEHPDQLVTKEVLLDVVWPKTYVSDVVLTVCIRELRRALGDERKTPRFIATVHGRGYRFLPTVTTSPPVVSSQHSVVSSPALPTQSSALSPQHSVLVGREADLVQLHEWLAKALTGERQLVFVTGEPGIGKTTLIEVFVSGVRGPGSEVTNSPEFRVKTSPKSEVRSLKSEPAPSPQPLAPGVWVGRGQCIEQYGVGEPYMPILEALGHLCREPGGERLIALLSQQAPTWLAQMPALLNATDLEALQRKTAGATRERMLREMGEAIDVLTAERPLVLWLEDLHWSDASTLELLAFVARRSQPARLLLLGTYRPVEMLSASHPLKQVTQELYAHQLGNELVQRSLTTSEVCTYLTLRFPESVFPTRLGEVLHHRTEGNPLFLATMVQEMVQHGVLSQTADGLWALQGEVTELKEWMPESVRYLLARQRERLMPEEQRVLEAASLAGVEFSAATVAAALETEIVQVEERCGRLAEQQQFLRLAGISEWPDGTRAARYGFLHALYQECWHERVSVNKQQQWHLQMGERKEAAYGQRAGEIAAELALHFEHGRNYRKAVQYLQQAGENAVRRSAHQEAIGLLTKGLKLLQIFPDTPERAQQELTLQLALNNALIFVKGFTAPEVEQSVTRARHLCQQLGETPQLFPVLGRLYMFYQNRAELQTTRELAEQMMRLTQSAQDRGLLLLAHTALGGTLYWLGELTSAQLHLGQAIALFGHQQHPRHTAGTADPRVHCLYYASVTLWHLGYPDQALKRSQEAVALATGLSHPFSLAQALGFATSFHSFRGERQIARERAEAVMTLSTEQGFPFWLAQGTIVRGGALAEQGQVEEGLAQMQQGLAAFRAMGAELIRTALLHLLAAAYGKVGRIEEGLSVVAEALAFVDKTGERFSEAELYRIKGELMLAQSSVQSLESEVQENQKSKSKRQKLLIPDLRPPTPKAKPKPVSSKPSTSPASNKPSHSNCAPR